MDDLVQDDLAICVCDALVTFGGSCFVSKCARARAKHICTLPDCITCLLLLLTLNINACVNGNAMKTL